MRVNCVERPKKSAFFYVRDSWPKLTLEQIRPASGMKVENSLQRYAALRTMGTVSVKGREINELQGPKGFRARKGPSQV